MLINVILTLVFLAEAWGCTSTSGMEPIATASTATKENFIGTERDRKSQK